MLKKIEEYILKNNMIHQGERILVGVSGGADSVCLLDVLNCLSPKLQCSLKVVHVNHLLRGTEAECDELFVRRLCERYELPCICIQKNVREMSEQLGISLEEAGRKARYEIFDSMEDIDKIAVAHHGDDQAETVLYNIIRGSSLKGAGGMRPVRDKIVRPLLCVTRKEIEQYLKERGMEYCTDSSNLENEYTRNKLRNTVIPFLKEEINPAVCANLNGFAEQLREYYDYVALQAREAWKQYCEGEDVLALDVEGLKTEHSVIRREVIMMALKTLAGTAKDFTGKHVEAVEELLDRQVSKQVHLPYGIVAMRCYQKIVIKYDRTVFEESVPFGDYGEEDFQFSIMEKPEGFQWEKFTNDYTKVFDYDKINVNLKLRKRMPGDYLIMDDSGRRKRLKSYFIDEKIPQSTRDKVWILADGSHVLWIVGYRTSAAYKVSSETKKLLVVTIRRNTDGI